MQWHCVRVFNHLMPDKCVINIALFTSAVIDKVIIIIIMVKVAYTMHVHQWHNVPGWKHNHNIIIVVDEYRLPLITVWYVYIGHACFFNSCWSDPIGSRYSSFHDMYVQDQVAGSWIVDPLQSLPLLHYCMEPNEMCNENIRKLYVRLLESDLE